MTTIIWLDDLRDPKDPQWAAWIAATGVAAERVIWVKDYEEFLCVFHKVARTGELTAVCFDNDLGVGREGRHAFTWMEEQVRLGDLAPFGLYAQTANPAARQELIAGFGSLRRFWKR